MLVSRIWGGLGNQLFQYAYAYALAKENDLDLKLDTSFFKNLNERSYKLNKFNLDYATITENKGLPSMIKIVRSPLVNKVIRIVPKFDFIKTNNWTYLKETRFKYNENLRVTINKNMYIDGYWQCEKYFEKYKEDLIRQITPKYENTEEFNLVKDEILSVNSVSVHIRRGDYANKKKGIYIPHLYLLDIKYYNNAIKRMNEMKKNCVYYIFSDDINWVKANLGNDDNFRFISLKGDTADIDEMRLMSNCKNNIVANSTFSWWGAWLNCNQEKIVISPNRYYGNKNIIPNNWIKVDVN